MRRVNITDFVAALLGVFVGLPTLFFPFGRDQGLYYYIGREWFLRGAIPYRDMLEHKTPGIFVVHGLAIRIFGEHMWSIRVVELAAVVAMGLAAAYAATPMRSRVPPGLRGIGVLGACLLYFGFFNFWDSAQCEIWVVVFVMFAFAAIARVRHPIVAAAIAGTACGLALVMKPAIFFLPVCAVVLLRRERVARLRVGLVFAATSAVPWLIVLSYFAAAGSSSALFDLLGGANRHYLTHEPGVDGPVEVFARSIGVIRIYGPLGAALSWGCIVAGRRASKRRDVATRDAYLLVLALTCAAYAIIFSQMKFYFYHWGVVLLPMTLAVTTFARDAWHFAIRCGRRRTFGAIFIASTVGLYLTTMASEFLWFMEAKHVLLYETGKMSRDEFGNFFRVDILGFNERDDHAVAEWLRANSSPNDRVAVRGFEPEIYAESGRTYGGRFFWTL
ncbi:MAG TPA: hypothetical protein VGH87_21455, partial [Polyangiaceae bacterium]